MESSLSYLFRRAIYDQSVVYKLNQMRHQHHIQPNVASSQVESFWRHCLIHNGSYVIDLIKMELVHWAITSNWNEQQCVIFCTYFMRMVSDLTFSNLLYSVLSDSSTSINFNFIHCLLRCIKKDDRCQHYLASFVNDVCYSLFCSGLKNEETMILPLALFDCVYAMNMHKMCHLNPVYFVNFIFCEFDSVHQIKEFNQMIKRQSVKWNDDFISDIAVSLDTIIDIMANKKQNKCSNKKMYSKFLQKTQSLWESANVHIGVLNSAKTTSEALKAKNNKIINDTLIVEKKFDFCRIEEKMNLCIHTIAHGIKSNKMCLKQLYKEIDGWKVHKLKGIGHYLEYAMRVNTSAEYILLKQQQYLAPIQRLCISLFYINVRQNYVRCDIKIKDLSMYLSILVELFDAFSIEDDASTDKGEGFVFQTQNFQNIAKEYVIQSKMYSNSDNCKGIEHGQIYQMVSTNQRLNKLMSDWLAQKSDFSSFQSTIKYKLPLKYKWNVFALFRDMMIVHLRGDGQCNYDMKAFGDLLLKHKGKIRDCDNFCSQCWYILGDDVINYDNIKLYVEFIANSPKILFDDGRCDKMDKSAFTQTIICKYFYWIDQMDDECRNNLITAFDKNAFVCKAYFELLKNWNDCSQIIEECKAKNINSRMFEKGIGHFGCENWSKICVIIHLQCPLMNKLIFENKSCSILLELSFCLLFSRVNCHDFMRMIAHIVTFDCAETVSLLLCYIRTAKSMDMNVCNSLFKIKTSLCVICVSFQMLKAITANNKNRKVIEQNIKMSSNKDDIDELFGYLEDRNCHGMNVIASRNGICAMSSSQINNYLMVCALTKIWKGNFQKHICNLFVIGS